MKSTTASTQTIPPAPSGPALRPARALIGWMVPAQAALCLASGRADRQPDAESLQKAETLRAGVAARPPWVDKTGVVTDAPARVVAYGESLIQHPSVAPFFAQGWRVAVVDLSKTCAIQPLVFCDGLERISTAHASDLLSLAVISLPTPAPDPTPAQFDSFKQAWVFSSLNPNLRITGQAGGQIQPGVSAFGFAVGVTSSYMQVVCCRGRHLLRDGYHRAFAFLRSGITHVPAFVRHVATIDEMLLPPGLLGSDVFLGDRPPLLTDYDNDDVSSDVLAPATRKVVIVQGMEISMLG